jgi:hypothetical protein
MWDQVSTGPVPKFLSVITLQTAAYSQVLLVLNSERCGDAMALIVPAAWRLATLTDILYAFPQDFFADANIS